MTRSKEIFQQQTEWDLHENTALVPLEFTEESKPELFGIDQEKAQGMVSGLSTTIAEREVLKNAYVDVIKLDITTENLPIFKELRLKIRDNRTKGIEKWHEKNKAFYLNGGRFVDSIKNKEVLVNQEMEDKLMQAEKFFENQEKERVLKLQSERILLVQPYLDSVIGLDLTIMDNYMFDDFLNGSKARFEAKIKAEKEESERLENERIEREKEIELQRIENEKLKAEAEEREKEIETDRKRQAEILAKAEAKQKAIQDEADKKAREEKNKQDAILKAEQEARAKIEAELQAKKDSEIKAIAENNARILAGQKEAEKLAKAPIKKQMNVWVDSFSYANPLENETSKDIIAKFEAFKKWAKLEIEKL